jgi:hypothetical protein
MITELLVLNSSLCGSRDLWWVDDPEATKGYNIYRAYDHPSNWHKLNSFVWSGHFWRDQASLEEVEYLLKDSDWVERGGLGRWGFKLPEIPYSDVVHSRPKAATSPDDVKVFLTDITDQVTEVRPVEVRALDQTVWLPADNTLPPGGAVSDEAQVYTDNVNKANYGGTQRIIVKFKRLANYVDIYTSMVRQFYTVVGVGEHGELHKPGADRSKIVNTQEVDNLTWEFAEMVNRNQWIFEQVGEPAYILFRRTRGEPCGCVRPEAGLGAPRHGCPSCYETGVVGGYYGPYDILYIPPDSALIREIDEGGGIKATRESRSFLTNTPIVQDGDLIVRRNGERLVIHGVTSKNPRGVLLQQDFGVELLKEGDTRYLIPIKTGLPTLFDPIVRNNPDQGIDPHRLKGDGEPLVDVRDQPDKQPWENKSVIPIGRTVAFGRILGSPLDLVKRPQ